MTVKGVYSTWPKGPCDLKRAVTWPRADGRVGPVAAPPALARRLLSFGCSGGTVLGADGAIQCVPVPWRSPLSLAGCGRLEMRRSWQRWLGGLRALRPLVPLGLYLGARVDFAPRSHWRRPPKKHGLNTAKKTLPLGWWAEWVWRWWMGGRAKKAAEVERWGEM